MGISQNLGRLRELYISGMLTDEEYDAGRLAIFRGELIDDILNAAENKAANNQPALDD